MYIFMTTETVLKELLESHFSEVSEFSFGFIERSKNIDRVKKHLITKRG